MRGKTGCNLPNVIATYKSTATLCVEAPTALSHVATAYSRTLGRHERNGYGQPAACSSLLIVNRPAWLGERPGRSSWQGRGADRQQKVKRCASSKSVHCKVIEPHHNMERADFESVFNKQVLSDAEELCKSRSLPDNGREWFLDVSSQPLRQSRSRAKTLSSRFARTP